MLLSRAIQEFAKTVLKIPKTRIHLREMAQSKQPRFTVEQINQMQPHRLLMNVQSEGLDPTGDEPVLRNRLIKAFHPDYDIEAQATTTKRCARSIPRNQAASKNSPSPPKVNPKVSVPKTWSRTLIQNATIAKLEQGLKDAGLSIECQTTRRRDELKLRLRNHYFPDDDNKTTFEGQPNELDFLKYGSVLKRIPKGSRPKAAKVLSQILQKIVQKNDNASWQSLFQFARSCLGGTKRGGKKNKSHATIVNKRLETFTGGAQQSNPTVNNKFQPSMRNLVGAKVSAADISGAVRIMSSSDKVLPPSEEVANKLREKHPDSHILTDMPEHSETESVIIGKEDVKRAIASFPNGSSGGPDGLLPQHLKDMTNFTVGDPANTLLDDLVDFFNKIVLCGNVPKDVLNIFFGANLTALSKKDNGVRPIAVGFTLRRMAGKMLMCKVNGKCETLLRPEQLGVGTPKGAEAAVHAIRAYVESPENKNKVLLKIDMKNAFNQVRRDVILKLVKEHTPEIFQYVYQCYSQTTSLFFGSYSEDGCVIESKEGVQQGDPLGPFLYSLAYRNLTKSLKSELNLWYLDDGTIADDLDVVLADYKKILEAAESLGPPVNPNKCELYRINPESDECKDALEKFCEITEGVRLIEDHELTLLGAPILPEAIEGVLVPKLDSLKLMVSRLEEIDKHDALFLLRQCFAIPKMTYFFRTSPCFMKPEILKSYDEVIKSALTDIINLQFIDDKTWDQCTLPVKNGGLGIRSAEEVSLPAYLSSVQGSLGTTHSLLPSRFIEEKNEYYENACEEWFLKSGKEILPENPIYQSSWDRPICEKKLEGLIENADSDVDKARLKAISSEGASNYLNALPLPSLGLKLSDAELPIVIALRLGATLCQPHQCICGKDVEPDGLHGLNCDKQIGRTPRHTEANVLIKRALAQLEIPSILEPHHLIDSEGRVPDGVTAFPFKQGKCLTWDFTCINTICDTFLFQCAKQAGQAAVGGEKRKKAHYDDKLLKNYIFVPIAVETFGSWGPIGFKFIKDIGRKIQEKTGNKNATSHILQGISMSVQRGNAHSIMGTLGPQRKLEDYFDILMPREEKL